MIEYIDSMTYKFISIQNKMPMARCDTLDVWGFRYATRGQGQEAIVVF